MTARVAIVIVTVLWFACGTRASAEPGFTTRFDEFGVVGHCDLGARLDNFAIALLTTPDSTGFVVSYGPDIEGPGSGRSVLLLIKDYLVNTRGLPGRRIKTIYGGRNQVLIEPKTQLWIVPAGVTAPEPQQYETDIASFKGLFSGINAGDIIEIEVLDEMGPGIGRPIHAAFADMLQQQKKAIAYIVTYTGENSAPGTSRRLATSQVEHLKQYKVNASQLKTIYGGTRRNSMVELWIMSAHDRPPVEDAGDEPPLRKSIQLTWQPDTVLGNEANERAVFNRLQQVLRADPALRAFVLVRLEGQRADADADAHSEEPVADLPKLVQKWREELTNRHKIRPDRFIVVFTNPPELVGNHLYLWIVPPGQPFPDPEEPEDDPSDVVEDPERRP